MPLDNATVNTHVEAWAASASPAWNTRQIDAVVAAIQALSEEVTPHIVADAVLAASTEQEFLLARCRRAIEDWLSRAAAGMRPLSGGSAAELNDDGTVSTPIRSATLAELEELDDVGPTRAVDVARAGALHPDLRTMADLERIPGIGAATVASLERQAHLDRPVASIASATTLTFTKAPSIETYLGMVAASDVEITFGDANTLTVRPPAGGDSATRFLALVELTQREAQKRRSPAAGTFASAGTQYVTRQAKRRALVGAMSPVDGTVIVNDDYVAAAVELISQATATVKVMMFLATATSSVDEDVGSLVVIDALEARAAALPAGSVSVILDRDDQDDPYHSAEINQPLIDRLTTAGVNVKSDGPDTLLHSKFVVIDDTAVIVGSHNITSAAFNNTHEVSVRLDGAVATDFEARFDTVWAALA